MSVIDCHVVRDDGQGVDRCLPLVGEMGIGAGIAWPVLVSGAGMGYNGAVGLLEAIPATILWEVVFGIACRGRGREGRTKGGGGMENRNKNKVV